MGKGFAPVKAKPEKPPAKRAKLTPISQIQSDLSSYFTDIKDPRVNRWQVFEGFLRPRARH